MSNLVELDAGKLENLLARHVSPDGGLAQSAHIDERDRYIQGPELAADEIGLDTFSVKSGKEIDGRHLPKARGSELQYSPTLS